MRPDGASGSVTGCPRRHQPQAAAAAITPRASHIHAHMPRNPTGAAMSIRCQKNAPSLAAHGHGHAAASEPAAGCRVWGAVRFKRGPVQRPAFRLGAAMSVTSPWRAAWSGLLLAVVWLSPVCTLRAADVDTGQRQAFMQAYAAAQAGDAQWRTLAAGLADYPLYPYLEAAALEHDLRQLDPAAVEAYLRRYPDWLPAEDLRRDFLLELARRQDWSSFSAMYQPGLGDTLACDALQARLSRGEALDFDADLATLWTRAALPSACDPVLRAAQAQGLLTTARLWDRIDRAATAGQGGTIAALAGWLPADQSPDALALALALRDPVAAVSAAAKWPDAPRYRQAATLALTQLARRQVSNADRAWQDLQGRFAFSVEQRNQVLHALALFHATDFGDQA